MFDNEDVLFWKTQGINHLRWPQLKEYHEGENNIHKLVEFVGDKTVRDIGCGYGRLSKFFDQNKYIGYDICEAAVKKANRLFSGHQFVHWKFENMNITEVSFFFNGPHLVNHSDISELIRIICLDTNAVIFGEIMDPTWSGSFVFKEYRRTVEEYDILFEKNQLTRSETYIGEHELWKKPFTIAKWERY